MVHQCSNSLGLGSFKKTLPLVEIGSLPNESGAGLFSMTVTPLQLHIEVT